MGEYITIEAQGGFEKYKRLRELIERTQTENPKPADVTALRELLEASPELWRATSTMAQRAVNHITRTYLGANPYLHETAKLELADLRDSLGFDAAPPLERFLIEQILVCRLNLYLLELNTATKLCEPHSTETGLYWDRRLTNAQRRFTRACESLARVRKLTAQTKAAGERAPLAVPVPAPLRAVPGSK